MMLKPKSIAQKLAALLTLLPISAGIALSSISENRALAQPVRGALGQCILDLQQAYIYGPTAADRCINQLQNQPLTQSLGQCIEDIKLAYIYGPNAADRCERLLAAQQRNGGQNFANRPASNSRRVVRVNNNTGGNIVGLYLSPVSSDDWGANRLNGTFNSGYFINFTLSGSECAYDIRADFDDGSYVQDQFDSCRSNTYNLN